MRNGIYHTAAYPRPANGANGVHGTIEERQKSVIALRGVWRIIALLLWSSIAERRLLHARKSVIGHTRIRQEHSLTESHGACGSS